MLVHDTDILDNDFYDRYLAVREVNETIASSTDKPKIFYRMRGYHLATGQFIFWDTQNPDLPNPNYTLLNRTVLSMYNLSELEK